MTSNHNHDDQDAPDMFDPFTEVWSGLSDDIRSPTITLGPEAWTKSAADRRQPDGNVGHRSWSDLLAPSAGPSRTDSPGWETVARQPKAVPDEFKPLVKILKRQRVEGISNLVFSQVGALLSQEMPTSSIYEKAGVTKLKEYIALAETEKIVRIKTWGGLGDINTDLTVSLHPRLCK